MVTLKGRNHKQLSHHRVREHIEFDLFFALRWPRRNRLRIPWGGGRRKAKSNWSFDIDTASKDNWAGGTKTVWICLFAFKRSWAVFHCPPPCPVKCAAYLTGVNGNGKIISLCDLPSGLSLRVEDSVSSPARAGRAVKNILSIIRIAKLGPSWL